MNSSFIKNDNIIEVDITTNEYVLVNQDIVEIDNLCDSLHVLLFNHKFFGRLSPRYERDRIYVIVSIYSHRNVTYKKFIRVNDKIEEAYNHAWNTLAYSKYSKPFNELDDQRKDQIKNILPKIISEADPSW